MSEDVKKTDVVVLGGPTEDGKGAQVLRMRPDRVETGEVRPLEEGKPIAGGEVVRLKPRDEAPAVCDVEVLHTIKHGTKPAQVASRAYRKNWETIFGARDRASSLN